jgi:hypothetical protein
MSDTSTGDDGSMPSWVDMNGADGGPNATACDNHPGVPCGWSATPNPSDGYTCGCRHPTWADPWTCEANDAGGVGMACSAGDAGHD